MCLFVCLFVCINCKAIGQTKQERSKRTLKNSSWASISKNKTPFCPIHYHTGLMKEQLAVTIDLDRII